MVDRWCHPDNQILVEKTISDLDLKANEKDCQECLQELFPVVTHHLVLLS